jgi:hypothetical protein
MSMLALGKAEKCWPIIFFKFVCRPIMIFYPIKIKETLLVGRKPCLSVFLLCTSLQTKEFLLPSS